MPRFIDPSKPVTVYALASSQDLIVRYIGQTCDLKARMQSHLREMRVFPDRYVSKWKNKVIHDGFEIVCITLKEQAIWADDEIRLIAEYRERGFSLVNGTDGGDGVIGYKLKPGHIEKLVLSARTRAITPETRARLSQAKRAMWANMTPEKRADIGRQSGEKLRGVKRSDEFKKKVGDGHRGIKHNRTAPVTIATREKLSVAAKGKTPENLAGIHARMIGRPKPLQVREKISESLKGKRQSPETNAKRAATLKAKFATPEYKLKRSEWVKKAWRARKGKMNGLDG